MDWITHQEQLGVLVLIIHPVKRFLSVQSIQGGSCATATLGTMVQLRKRGSLPAFKKLKS